MPIQNFDSIQQYQTSFTGAWKIFHSLRFVQISPKRLSVYTFTAMQRAMSLLAMQRYCFLNFVSPLKHRRCKSLMGVNFSADDLGGIVAQPKYLSEINNCKWCTIAAHGWFESFLCWYFDLLCSYIATHFRGIQNLF